MKEKFPGVYIFDNKFATENSVPGYRPFSEQLVKEKGKEYRVWDVFRSKLGAAIAKGLKELPIKKGSRILYLGAAHGFTCSFIANIIGEEGIIYAVEFSDRCFKEFLPLCEKYKNIVPILADARFPERFGVYEKVDLVFEDIADQQLAEVAIMNCKAFLKKDGWLMLSIKSRSIDVVANPKQIVSQEIEKLKKAGFEIVDWKMLDPLEKDHGFVLARMKQSS